MEVAIAGSVIGADEPINTMSEQSMLKFPKTTIKEGWQRLGEGKVDKVIAGLTFAGGTTTLIGLADLELESAGEWGTLAA